MCCEHSVYWRSPNQVLNIGYIQLKGGPNGWWPLLQGRRRLTSKPTVIIWSWEGTWAQRWQWIAVLSGSTFLLFTITLLSAEFVNTLFSLLLCSNKTLQNLGPNSRFILPCWFFKVNKILCNSSLLLLSFLLDNCCVMKYSKVLIEFLNNLEYLPWPLSFPLCGLI